MNIAKPEIRVTFPRDGIAANNAFTTILSPSFRLIIRNGLKALKALSDLRLFKAEFLSDPMHKLTMLTSTTKKSSWFQETLI